MSRRLLKSPDGQEIRERIVPARRGFAGEAAGFARAASTPAGLSRLRLDDVERTVEAAFLRVALRGFGDRPGSVCLVVGARPGEVEVQVRDRGETLEFPIPPERKTCPDEMPEDEASYAREGEENVLTLRFRNRP